MVFSAVTNDSKLANIRLANSEQQVGEQQEDEAAVEMQAGTFRTE
jgi:hypothetical protein